MHIWLHCNVFGLHSGSLFSTFTLLEAHMYYVPISLTYPLGDEVSAHHQVILGNPSIAWENWKKPALREEHTKTVIQQHYALINSLQ